MSKKYYFLSGLPRSGNTLLGSILNQNRNISVTGNSPVAEIFHRVESTKQEMFSVKNFPNEKSFDNISKNIFENYYLNWKSKYIIDRSCWGTPDNLKVLKKYCPNDVKIIVLTRDLNEVLASFIKWSIENPNNFLDRYRTVEEKCDFLMNPQGQIVKQLYSIYNLNAEENKRHALFIKYDELVDGPDRVISKIYNFLNIKKFNHHYANISQFSANEIGYCDTIYGKNLHRVKSEKVEKTNYNPIDYVPQHIMDKYSSYNLKELI